MPIDPLEAMREHGTYRRAAEALGISYNAMKKRVYRALAVTGELGGPPIPPAAVPPDGFVIRRNSAAYDADGNLKQQWIESGQGNAEGYEVPPGHVVKGESALLDPNGNVIVKWIKTKEETTHSMLADALEARFAAYEGAAPVIPAPASTDDHLITIYPLADLHFGLYSWGEETGDDYNVDIAKDLVRKTVSTLVAKSNPSRRAVILGLGDLFHQNDQKNATPRSHHQLDVDGRWGRVFEAGAQLITDIVDLVAAKHKEIDVVILPGNHDEDASVCLRVALSLFYRNTRRINVINKPGLHWFDRFGKCLFGATHGHTMKPERMAMMLAADRAKDWGETEHRSFFFGHIHHETAKEVGPVRVESFGTPVAKDAYAAGGGYRAGRSMSAITFHIENGEESRHRVNIAGNWATVRRAAA